MLGPAKAKLFVLCCIDPRFRTALQGFLERKFRISPEHYDLKTDAGGVREVARGTSAGEWILKNLEIGVHKHGVTEVVLCNHMDCSYYGGSTAFDTTRHQVDVHKMDLLTASDVIRKRFPQLRIHAYVIAHQEQFVLEEVKEVVVV
jgi:carbonic anhydrase